MSDPFDDFRPVTEVNGNGAAGDLFALADKLLELRSQKLTAEANLSSINQDIETLQLSIIERMMNEDMPRFTRGGQTFYMTSKTHVSTRKDMAENVREWLRDNGYEHMVGETVNPARLKSFVCELDDKGELPEELGSLLHVFTKPLVAVRPV